jgi:hypothetical protein
MFTDAQQLIQGYLFPPEIAEKWPWMDIVRKYLGEDLEEPSMTCLEIEWYLCLGFPFV